MVVVYKIWKKYNEIQLTKMTENKRSLLKQKRQEYDKTQYIFCSLEQKGAKAGARKRPNNSQLYTADSSNNKQVKKHITLNKNVSLLTRKLTQRQCNH